MYRPLCLPKALKTCIIPLLSFHTIEALAKVTAMWHRIGLPWAKTRHYDCGEGRIRIVYRNVDHAFPLYLTDLKSKTKATVDVVHQVKGQISQEHQETIKALLFKIDEKNNSAQTQLRAAYIVYSSAPCEKLDYLQQTIDDIRANESQIRAVESQVNQIVLLVRTLKTGAKNVLQNAQIAQCLEDALSALARPLYAPQLEKEMSRVPLQTREWLRGG